MKTENARETVGAGGRLASVIAETAPRGAQVDRSRLPLTEEEVTALGDVLLWRILVQPYIPRYRGAVQVASSVDEAERVIAKVGRIVAQGCFAWKSKTNAGLDLSQANPLPKVGDYVLYEMYAGQKIMLRSGQELLILNETELLMKINDPELIRGYL